MRSLPLGVANQNLAQGLDSERRLDALEWLVQAFDALSLPDTQLFAAFGLLDRYAAASPAPISVGQGAFALVLAAMLIALKVAGTQRDLERAKRLVVEVSGSSKPWAAVRRAELSILRRLSFRACTPTAREILDRILEEVRQKQEPAGGSWDAKACDKCADLARFLLELAVVHDPEAVYGPGRPPLTAAAAAVLLALRAVGAPRAIAEVVQEPLRLLGPGSATVAELAEAMRQRWASEEQRVATGTRRAVAEKWLNRVKGTFGASPPAASDLRQYVQSASSPVALVPDCSVKEPVRGASPPVPPPRRPSIVSTTAEVLAAIPTPARRCAAVAGAGEAAPMPTAAAVPQLRVHKPVAREATLRPEGHGGDHGGAAAKIAALAVDSLGEPQPVGAAGGLFRGPCMQENLAAWQPEAEAGTTSSPPVPPKGTLQAARVAAITAAIASAGPPQAVHAEPLVDLTHVLNVMAARQTQQGHHGILAGGGAKHRSASVAAELLVTSALRMQWPVDRRKVGAGDAAMSCREAAAVLHEAALQLESAADSLENGTSLARDLKPVVAGSESKRRRTFGGPSPTRAVSPASVVLAAHRGSPPVVRFAGLRV